MNKKSKQKPALIKIMFLTLITLLTWVGFEVYGIISQEPNLTNPDEKILAPLDPELDSETLNSLSLRVYLNQNQIEDNLLIEPATPTPTPQPEEEEEEGVEPTETPEPEIETTEENE